MMKDGEEFDVPNAGSIIIPDKMSVNTKAGFSIVQYQGDNNNGGGAVPHGLNKRPDFILIKPMDVAGNWLAWSSAIEDCGYFHLDLPNAEASDSSYWHETGMNNETVGIKIGVSNLSGSHIMYCWHSVPGYSAFGKYTGNDGGNFIYTGFKPAFVMFKKITPAESWIIADNARDPDNPTQKYLIACLLYTSPSPRD